VQFVVSSLDNTLGSMSAEPEATQCCEVLQAKFALQEVCVQALLSHLALVYAPAVPILQTLRVLHSDIIAEFPTHVHNALPQSAQYGEVVSFLTQQEQQLNLSAENKSLTARLEAVLLATAQDRASLLKLVQSFHAEVAQLKETNARLLADRPSLARVHPVTPVANSTAFLRTASSPALDPRAAATLALARAVPTEVDAHPASHGPSRVNVRVAPDPSLGHVGNGLASARGASEEGGKTFTLNQLRTLLASIYASFAAAQADGAKETLLQHVKSFLAKTYGLKALRDETHAAMYRGLAQFSHSHTVAVFAGILRGELDEPFRHVEEHTRHALSGLLKAYLKKKTVLKSEQELQVVITRMQSARTHHLVHAFVLSCASAGAAAAAARRAHAAV
jgi:hypothetical protein